MVLVCANALYQSVTPPKVSCYIGSRRLDLLFFSCPVRKSGENMLCVELFKGADLITVVGVRYGGNCMRNALLTWVLTSISSTWSERSTHFGGS
jgi:hypothetical protein